MRFAFSAMAATSGLLLLGLAFYGQPALYLQQLREVFGAGPAADQPETEQPAEADRNAVDERMTALQQQVARLRDELAAKQALEAQAATAMQSEPDQPMQPVPSEPAPAATPPPVLKPAPSVALTTQSPPSVPPPEVQMTAGVDAQGESVKLDAAPSVASAPVLPLPPPLTAQQRRDLAVAESASAKVAAIKLEPPKPTAAKTELAKLEPPKADAARTDAAKPMLQKPAAAKAPPPTPPLPSSPHQDVDDTQSVLARLRQIGPATVQQSDSADMVELRQPEPRPPLPPPSLPKLNSARAALAAGRVDDARRLLQEAQLQLVFRPVNATGNEQPLAGKGAADVAHALEALSANNIPLSRRYIDVAADDLSGRGTSVSPQAPELRTTGYAPAYPPR